MRAKLSQLRAEWQQAHPADRAYVRDQCIILAVLVSACVVLLVLP